MCILIWFFNFLTFSGSGAECPDGFPTLEKHTASNHGDVCRSGKTGPIGVGWYCVPGCFGRSSAPWCVQSGTENDPCRASKIKFHTMISFILSPVRNISDYPIL